MLKKARIKSSHPILLSRLIEKNLDIKAGYIPPCLSYKQPVSFDNTTSAYYNKRHEQIC